MASHLRQRPTVRLPRRRQRHHVVQRHPGTTLLRHHLTQHRHDLRVHSPGAPRHVLYAHLHGRVVLIFFHKPGQRATAAHHYTPVIPATAPPPRPHEPHSP